MSARLQEQSEWNGKFMRGLPGPYKTFWIWLKSACDHAGIWDVDIELARLITGQNNIELSEAETLFSAKIIIICNGDKWFLVDFVEGQLKTKKLNWVNTYHRGVINIFEKFDIFKISEYTVNKELIPKKEKELQRGFEATKIKDKIKIKDNVIMNITDKEVITKVVPKVKVNFDLFWVAYDKKVGDKSKIEKKWNELSLTDQGLILEHIPQYKLQQPDKWFRKDPATYLNNKSWLDEIISKPATVQNSTKTADIINLASQAQYKEA